MEFSIGRKIYELRRSKGLTQEQLAEQMNVSPQAVSKWENDQSCPDVMALPKLAKLLGVSVDELLGAEKEPTVVLLPEEKREPAKRVLKIRVLSADGDTVNVNLPLELIKAALEIGIPVSSLTASIGGETAQKIDVDFEKIMELVDRGLIGTIADIHSADGDTVEIVVE